MSRGWGVTCLPQAMDRLLKSDTLEWMHSPCDRHIRPWGFRDIRRLTWVLCSWNWGSTHTPPDFYPLSMTLGSLSRFSFSICTYGWTTYISWRILVSFQWVNIHRLSPPWLAHRGYLMHSRVCIEGKLPFPSLGVRNCCTFALVVEVECPYFEKLLID